MVNARSVRGILALVVAWVLGVALIPAARAQEPQASVRLLAQTPWTTNDDPILRLRVRATNLGASKLADVSVGFAMGAPVRARNEYHQMLTDGPPFIVFAPAPTPIDDGLPAGAAADVRLEADLTGAVSGSDSLVYPATITLFAGGQPLTSVVTPVLHLVRDPQVPIPFAWWTTLARGPVFDPAGHLADPTLEPDLASGGRLHAGIRALGRLAERDLTTALTVVVEPLLLAQLGRMAEGYERADGAVVEAGSGGAADAEDLLARLDTAVSDPAVSLVALPFASPELPALLRSGLVDRLGSQYELGGDELEAKLGQRGDGIVGFAPEHALDEASISYLARRGVGVLLAAPDAVPRPPQERAFAPPPTASVTTDGGGVTLVLPDPSTQALFERADLRADPVRLAQAVLGELAVIWREQPVPVPPTVRGLAVEIPSGLPAGAWTPLAQRLARAPFLAATQPAALVDTVSPTPGPSTLSDPSSAAFTDDYVRAIREASRAVEAIDATAVDGSEETADLRAGLAVAESGVFVGAEPRGRAWIGSVVGRASARFDRLAPLPDQVFTLTSARGTIPIRFGGPAEPHRVVVELRSSWFSFPDGAVRTVTLEDTDRPVPFTVEAAGAGRRSIQVLVRAGPSGMVIAQRNVIVGSTTANRLALLITGAAALVLIALWARRLVSRARR